MKYVLKFHDDILKLDAYQYAQFNVDQFAQYWEGGIVVQWVICCLTAPNTWFRS